MKQRRAQPAIGAWDRLLVACVGGALACATLLLNYVAEQTGDAARPAWPSWLDSLFALPVPLTDVTDLRFYVVPAALAVLLIAIAAGMRVGGPDGAPAMPTKATAAAFWQRHWLEALAFFTVAWAAGSAWVNGTWELSRGWIFFLAAHAAWAAALGRFVDERCIRRVIVVGSVIAVVASLLSILHYRLFGIRFFQLPVGPVTLTAALGALWAVMAAGRLTARFFDTGSKQAAAARGTIWTCIVLAASLWLCIEARRRGAMIALVGAMALAIGWALWNRYPRRGVRAGLIVGVVVLIAAGAAFVWQQSTSLARVTSVPLRIRYTYWEKMAEMIPQAPLFGYGPDLFAARMTTELALVRAEQPHILHGGVDYDAHNEWFQAVWELGLPGGLAYLAIPVTAILMAAWRWVGEKSATRRVLLFACAAGLCAIIIGELSSINLRYSTLAAWYWTLLGTTAALLRGAEVSTNAARGIAVGQPQERTASSRRGASWVMRIGAGLAAAAVAVVVALDVQRAWAHGEGRRLLGKDDQAAVPFLRKATRRLGASRWLMSRRYLATALTRLHEAQRSDGSTMQLATASRRARPADPAPASATADGRTEWGDQAVAVWSELAERCPAFLDAGYERARAQRLNGDRDGALNNVRAFLSRVDPYHKDANLLYLELADPDAEETLACVLRSLRSDHWDAVLLRRLHQALADSDVAAAWPRRVRAARSELDDHPDGPWSEPLAPEVLRAEAFRLVAGGDLAGAADIQHIAAEAYERLAERNSTMRRLTPAEADAWYLAARFRFENDPGQYRRAFEMIRRAEKRAAEGILTDRIPDADPNAEWVGGQVMPLETPERLRMLWRFSAMMRLTVRDDPQQIMRRITWSLPPERRGEADVNAELGRLAAELVTVFQRVPVGQRPETYARLVEFARQYAPDLR